MPADRYRRTRRSASRYSRFLARFPRTATKYVYRRMCARRADVYHHIQDFLLARWVRGIDAAIAAP